MSDSVSFDSFLLAPELLANIAKLNFEKPTPIQAQSIPAALEGRDLMGLAQTGTGKTAAFLLPIFTRLLKSGTTTRNPRALVLVPTRELAEQIREAAVAFAAGTGLRAMTIFGGVSMHGQVSRLRQGCDIVIACPGRLLDHMQQRTIDLREVEVLVLDEADHMFDMGFLPNIRRILKNLPTDRQTLLLSATMPSEIRGLATDILRNPVTVEVGRVAPAATVSHAIYPVSQHLKSALLIEMLKKLSSESVLVFTRTKHRAKKLESTLQREEFAVTSLHGNLSQNRRQESMAGFRSGKYQVLVATDIAARGIDIAAISHVINFDIPDTTEAYTHRIGRTGRAERTGDAFTLVCREDEGMIRQIERVLKSDLERKTLEGFDYNQVAKERSEVDSRGDGRAQDRRGRGRSGGSQGRSSDRRDRPSDRSRDSFSRESGSRDSRPRDSQRPERDAAPRSSGSFREQTGDAPRRPAGDSSRSDARPRSAGNSDRAPRSRSDRPYSDRGPRSFDRNSRSADRTSRSPDRGGYRSQARGVERIVDPLLEQQRAEHLLRQKRDAQGDTTSSGERAGRSTESRDMRDRAPRVTPRSDRPERAQSSRTGSGSSDRNFRPRTSEGRSSSEGRSRGTQQERRSRE